MLSYTSVAGDSTVTNFNGSRTDFSRCRIEFYGSITNAQGDIFLPKISSFSLEKELVPTKQELNTVTSSIRRYSNEIQTAAGQDLTDIQVCLHLTVLSPSF